MGLERFPIYFFCDEAANAVRAEAFIRDGFRDQFGQFFPAYFQNGGFFNLSASVYAQILPRALFGPSVFATRATSVLFALSGMVAVGLIGKRILRLRFPFLAVLLLSITPAWFLHTRTAFETVMASAFYAWFLYFYFRYRDGGSRSLFWCLLFGALAFYTYSPMQLVVVLTGVLLALSDLRFHWRRRADVLRALLFLLLLAVPYARALRTHPEDTRRHLQQLYSYWTSKDLSAGQKLLLYGKEYARGLSPKFWYSRDNAADLTRHRMKGYGNIFWPTLPFAAAGLIACLIRSRSSPHRALLLALLATPAGAALAAVGVTRALVFVVPAALVTAIGVEVLLGAVASRSREGLVAVALFSLLAAAQSWMLVDALSHGPTWYHDYGLNGLQYGAREVFGQVRRDLARDGELRAAVSPIWANGTTELLQFFLPGEPRAELHDLRWYEDQRQRLDEKTELVLTRDEYRRAIASGKLLLVRTDRVLSYPDGTEGFYFARMRYAADFDERILRERAARHALVRDTIRLGKETVEVAHSRFDTGEVSSLFDGDVKTLARTAGVNPAVVEITFRSPRQLRGVTVTTGAMDVCLTARLEREGGTRPETYATEYGRLPEEPTVTLLFAPSRAGVRMLRVEIENLRSGEHDFVHVREIRLEY